MQTLIFLYGALNRLKVGPSRRSKSKGVHKVSTKPRGEALHMVDKLSKPGWAYGKTLHSWEECAKALKGMKPKAPSLRSRIDDLERQLKDKK